MTRLLIYGLQRSGTNYVEEILRRRYRVELKNVGRRADPRHKHSRLYADKTLVPTAEYGAAPTFGTFAALEPSFETPVDHCIVISKNPYAWLYSYRRWAERCGWPSPAHPYAREYVEFYTLWADFAAQSEMVTLVQYDELLENPATGLARLERSVPLARRAWRIQSLAPRRVPRSAAFTEERRRAFLAREYISALGPEGVAEVNRYVPDALLSRLGYSRFEVDDGAGGRGRE